MKTAISIPDHTFEKAERAAKRLGMSRSEFFTRAAERFIESSENGSVTARVNASLERAGEDDSVFATTSGRAALLGDGDEW